MADALEELREMHAEAKAAFKKIEFADPRERRELWARLRSELEIHEKIEERFVYDPAARDVGRRDETLEAWEREHRREASEANGIMARIEKLDPAEALWLNSLHSLASLLESHMAEEENEIWPKIRQQWGERNLEEAARPVAVARQATTAGAPVADALERAAEAARHGER